MKRILFLFSFAFFLGFSAITSSFAASADNFSLQQFGMTFAQIKQAAAQGDPDAQYALGYMYYYGKDMPRDELTARMWIAKAAAQGQPQALRAQQLLHDTKTTIEATADTSAKRSQINSAITATEVTPASAAHPTVLTNEDAARNTDPYNSPNVNPSVAQQNGESARNLTSPNTAISHINRGTDRNDAVLNQRAQIENGYTVATNQAPTTNAAADAAIQNANASAQQIEANVANANASSAAQQASTTTTDATTMLSTTGTPTPIATDTQQNLGKNITREKLVAAPAHYYTIQIVGSHNKNEIIGLISKNHLRDKATYYQSSYDSKPWYVLVYGIFPTHQAALSALNKLPPSLHKLNPLVRSIASVKISMNHNPGNFT